MDNSALKILFLTNSYFHHENISSMEIFLTLSYFRHENIGWWQRKAVERMTLIPDKDKREQSWRWVANPRFCNQGIEHQKTFSQPSGHHYAIFSISDKATQKKLKDVHMPHLIPA